MDTMGGSFFHCVDFREIWSEFGIISQDCSLCDPFQKLFPKFWSVEKNGCHGGSFFRCVDFREILQNSSPLKPLVRFWKNLTELLLGWPFSKIFCKILIRRKTWSPWGWGGGDFLHYMDRKKFLKILLLLNCWSKFGIIHKIVPCVTLFKIVHEILIHRKKWRPWGEAFFTVWTSEKFFKILFLRNR